MTPTTPVPAAGAAHRADAAVQTVQLDGAELQAALHLAGLSPGTAAPFADLPPASSIEQAVLGSLHAKHVVNGNGVTDLCRGALATLAHPTHRAALYLGSLERWYYMEYYAGPGGLVGYSSDAREHRLTFPCTRDIASGTVEGWLGSLAVPDLPQAHAELEASELSAVAAIVDAWREETLRALLQREQPAPARFTREQLVYALDMAAHGDPRWLSLIHISEPTRPY